MKSKMQRSAMVLACSFLLAVLGVSCQTSDGDQARRLRKVETGLTQISGVVGRVENLEGKEGGLTTQLAELQASVTDLETKVSEYEKEVDSSTAASSDLKKKADELSGRVNTVSAKADALAGRIAPLEQRISLLQTRYDDHLRKYHSGG